MINKRTLYQVVFESETRAGKRFDVFLLWCIVVSIFVTVLDSVPYLNHNYKAQFHFIEWAFTVLDNSD